MDEDDSPPAVEIGATDLSPEALRGVIEAFVLQEGTDYGHGDISLDSKVEQVRGQIDRGEAQIMFDPATSSVSILRR